MLINVQVFLSTMCYEFLFFLFYYVILMSMTHTADTELSLVTKLYLKQATETLFVCCSGQTLHVNNLKAVFRNNVSQAFFCSFHRELFFSTDAQSCYVSLSPPHIP